jgi:hypothetical protein
MALFNILKMLNTSVINSRRLTDFRLPDYRTFDLRLPPPTNQPCLIITKQFYIKKLTNRLLGAWSASHAARSEGAVSRTAEAVAVISVHW